MRIAVMAAGAVGGYFGARLAAAGHDVTFIARGAHLDAIRNDGLIVESTLGNLHLQECEGDRRSGDVGPVDIVLFAVKLWDTEIAAELARPLIGSEHAPDHVSERRRQRRADRADPGRRPCRRRHRLYRDRDRAARRDRPYQPVCAHALRPRRRQGRCGARAFADAAKQAGIDIDTSTRDRSRTLAEIHVPGRHVRHHRRDPRSRSAVACRSRHEGVLPRLMQEVVAVARASGVDLGGCLRRRADEVCAKASRPA